MDEAEMYQQRLQAIAEKRRLQEEEEKVKRETEEELLKLAQNKRKYLREQWLMEADAPSNPEDPKRQSVIPALETTEQSAEETQGAERKKEEEKTEVINDESSQIGENEPSILSADSTEKPTQAYLEEGERNALDVLEVEAEGNPVSEAEQQDTEEKSKAETEEQVTDQLAMDAVEHVDLPCQSIEQIKTPDETHFSLTELIKTENTGEEEEWEMVNCCPEEDLDPVLTSDLTQAQADSVLDKKTNEEVLKVEQVFIMDEEEGLQVGAPEVPTLVAEKKSDLEDASCEKPPECALQNIFLEKAAHGGTSAPLQEPSNVSGVFSKESSVFSVECKQNMGHLPAGTTHAVEEIIRDNTKNKEDQHIPTSRVVKKEQKEASGAEDEVHQYIPIEREKSPPLKQREVVAAHSTEQESEIQTLMPPSGSPARAETVTVTKRKTCQCCTVM